MARRKKSDVVEDGPVEIVEGTVEWKAREHFEREKAAYEERTGIPCNSVPPHPLTSTPLPETDDTPPEGNEETDAGGDPETIESAAEAGAPADPEPENDEGESQGDE